MPRFKIELEPVDNFEDAKINCNHANEMLIRMGYKKSMESLNGFKPVTNQKYCNTFYNFIWEGAEYECDDNSFWLNF